MDITLRRLLDTVGAPLLEVLTAPVGVDVAIRGVAILDPHDEPADPPDRLVLLIGARGTAAVPAVAAVAARGAAAVAVKSGPLDVAALRTATAGTRCAVLAVGADVRWEHLEQLARDVLDDGATVDPDDPGDLFSLAQTTALLTRGIVSVEDTSSRVLAYSRSDGDDAQVDELRRLSILGWQGPPEYLRMLRGWGVFDRLRADEEVVEVDEHADAGIRRRLAVGIHAGDRWLGTIWVQEGVVPFAERAHEALVGAARVAAGHLLRRRSGQAPGPRWSRDLAVGLLAGRADPHLAAGVFGLDEHLPVLVAAFTVRADGAGPGAVALGLTELAEVVGVHAAHHRRAALTAADGARVYAVLPETDEGAARELCGRVVAVVARRTGVLVRAGLGSAVSGLAAAAVSRTEADRVLDTPGPDADVASIAELRAEIMLDQTLRMLQASPDLLDPAVARVLDYDAAHGTELAGSVLAWLDGLGDVRTAAAALTVHPNTLRYRLRRASEVGGLDLGDPRARLMHHLHLLRARRAPVD